MAEKTLAKPLSGTEVIEAVVDKLRDKMRRDCYLNPNSAYDWFAADITIKLDMHDTGSKVSVEHAALVTEGVKPVDDTMFVSENLQIEPAAPNTVRMETGQPIPTETKDAHGRRVERGVTYTRKGATQASARSR